MYFGAETNKTVLILQPLSNEGKKQSLSLKNGLILSF